MRKLVLACLGIFLIAAGVRFLVWQNNKSDIEQSLSGVTASYRSDALILLSGDIKKFVFGANPPIDASVLAHPPGYSILMAAVYGVFGDGVAMTLVQIFLNSFAPVFVFLIGFRLFDLTTALFGGILAAFSPQLAYNSAILLPDSLIVIAILAAVYFFIRARQANTLRNAFCCALSLGIACWLRSNVLFLPAVFFVLALVLLPKGLRLRSALLIAGTFLLILAPITIRNYGGFGRFIPVSLGAGVTFIEGIADYDIEGRFGLPATDEGVMEMDAINAGRPDYRGSLYSPDGIARESQRIQLGLNVVKSDPLWFAGVMARRGLSMFRFERVPAIANKDQTTETATGFSYYLNQPLKLLQKLFITAVFLPLLVIGVVLLLIKSESRAKLVILLAVPLYFACFQSLLHTEYRYVLAVQPFMLIIAAVVLDRFFKYAAGFLNAHRLARSQ